MTPDLSRYASSVERVEKPWGHELRFALTERYCGKLLFVKAGESLSLQYHRVKDEAWYVLEGRARLELGETGGRIDETEIEPGQAFHFPPGTVHRVTAIEDALILEASTPEIDDVVRLEDRYGRASASEPRG
jgi:mannose-6-phosphate isomerase-like protein (cupin superfamily)